MSDFTFLYYRLENYGLTNAPKQAGFVLTIPTPALAQLATIVIDDAERARLRALCTERMTRLWEAKMIRKGLIKSVNVVLWEKSPVPRFFTADPVFGGSLGADPEMFGRLGSPDTCAWLGDEVAYTPHNVDNAIGAVMLTVLVATWAEWAQNLLYGLPAKSSRA